MRVNWKTVDVPVAASMDAIAYIVQTADLPILRNWIRNLSLSQNLRINSEKNQQINYFLALRISSTVSSTVIFSVSTSRPFSFSLYSISVVIGAFR